jgi:hypothetical protein
MKWLAKKILSTLDFDDIKDFVFEIFKEPLLEYLEEKIKEVAERSDTEIDDKIAANLISYLRQKLED